MKKCLVLLFCIFLFYFYASNGIAKSLTIPNDAIRIRIIPNSNSSFDQGVKNNVKNKLEVTMYDLLKSASNSVEAREIIENNLNIIDEEVKGELIKSNFNLGYDINFGYNYFPEKEYKGVKYNEGYYESLLVTLGEGKGDNWWCVLFPPLCLIEADESSDVEYRSIIEEILEKYIH